MILKYMSTERQVADLLTKSLAKIAFERLRDGLTGYSCYNSPGNNIHGLNMRCMMSIRTALILWIDQEDQDTAINPEDQDSSYKSLCTLN